MRQCLLSSNTLSWQNKNGDWREVEQDNEEELLEMHKEYA